MTPRGLRFQITPPTAIAWFGRALALLATLPLAAQTPTNTVVIHGRVEDADSREPLQALILSADSATGVFADSLGNFSISLNSTPPYVVHAEDLGYEPTTFELPDSAPEQLSILILEALAIEGVTVVEENSLAALGSRMVERQDAYLGLVSVYDRDTLLAIGATSAYDLIQQRSMGYECPILPGEFCLMVRDREARLLVCIDEERPGNAIAELDGIPTESVVSAEFYGPTVDLGLYSGAGFLFGGAPILGSNPIYEAGQVRIYTRQWMVSTAARGDRALPLTGFGC